MYCFALTDQEVRSCIKFSGMFGDKSYATAPINELRQKLEWLRNTHPQSIPDHIQSKLNTRYNIHEYILCSIILVFGMILLKCLMSAVMFIQLYNYIIVYDIVQMAT